MSSWIYSTFLEPIQYEMSHNIVNILVYWGLFLGAVLILCKILQKIKIKIDFKLFFSLIPFIAAGSLLRALVDSNLYARNFFTITPGIYLVFLLVFFTGMLVSYFVGKNKYWLWNFGFGCLVFLGVLIPKIMQIQFENVSIVLGSVAGFAFLGIIIWLTIRRFNIKKLKSQLSQTAIYSHVLDGVSTSSLMFFVGGAEKHVVPRTLISLSGSPFSFLGIKILLSIFGVWYLNKEIQSKELKNALLIAIISIGLGPALRNLISYIIV